MTEQINKDYIDFIKDMKETEDNIYSYAKTYNMIRKICDPNASELKYDTGNQNIIDNK